MTKAEEITKNEIEAWWSRLTGEPFPVRCETTGSVSNELREELNSFYNHLRDEGKNLDDLGLQVVDENFWDLLLLD